MAFGEPRRVARPLVPLSAREGLGDPRRQRLGEEHAAADDRRPGAAAGGRASWSTATTSRRSPSRSSTGCGKKLGMMFQGGALLDSLTVFDNLALPLREHTRARPRGDRRRGARRARGRRPDRRRRAAAGPALRRHGEARRARARHHPRPVILLCDEPFSGLDPISARRIEALLVDINRQRGVTMIVVSHSIPSTMRMADRVVAAAAGRRGRRLAAPSCSAAPTRASSRSSTPGECRRPRRACRVGRSDDRLVQDLGWAVLRFVDRPRAGSRCSPSRSCGPRRAARAASGSFVDELYKLGVLSLVIICVCGLAVGMVLGLQGYNTLVRFGAAESLGAVGRALSLVRELGPVLTALLATGRAGSATDGRDRHDGRDRAARRPAHDVGRPDRPRRHAARPSP